MRSAGVFWDEIMVNYYLLIQSVCKEDIFIQEKN